MAQGLVEKVCVKCGKDVRNLPRTRDPKGNYWCTECYQAALARKKAARDAAPAEPRPAPAPAPASTPAEADPFDVGGLDHDMLSLVLDEAPAGPDPAAPMAASSVCPHCGHVLDGGAAICMGCGYNAKTGRVMSTKERREGAADKLVEAAGRGAMGATIVVTSIAGSLIGGAIGAALWAVISAKLNYEHSWIAIIVGSLSGAGAALGARGHAGLLTGLLACGVAILAIMSGKVAAVSVQFEELSERPVDETLAIEFIASDMMDEAGGSPGVRIRGLELGGSSMSRDDAMAKAGIYWRQMSPDAQERMLEDLRATHDFVTANPDVAAAGGVIATLDWVDGLFAVLALVAAFGLGSGGGGEMGSDD